MLATVEPIIWIVFTAVVPRLPATTPSVSPNSALADEPPSLLVSASVEQKQIELEKESKLPVWEGLTRYGMGSVQASCFKMRRNHLPKRHCT
jgi:hypothetical protein